MKRPIPAFWCLSPNFGDALTPYIIEKLTGHPVSYVDNSHDGPYLMVTGSILNWNGQNAIVWGCGLANIDDKVPPKDVRCVRGPITAQICKKQGMRVPTHIGDPALLLPEIYVPKAGMECSDVTVVPHYVDYHRVMEAVIRKNLRWRVVNLLDSVETVIDQIASSKKVYSSSLHGIIAAHAYGVPAAWAEFSDKIGGDGTKYADYYASVRLDVCSAGDWPDASMIPKLSRCETTLPDPKFVKRLTDHLKKSFPWDIKEKLWQ